MKHIDSYLTKELSNSLQQILHKMHVHVTDLRSLDHTKKILDCSQKVFKSLKLGEDFQIKMLKSILTVSEIDDTYVQEDRRQIYELIEVYGTIFAKVVISHGAKKEEKEYVQMNKDVVQKFLVDLILDLKTVILKSEDDEKALQKMNEYKKQVENDYQSLMRKQELKNQKVIDDLEKQKREQDKRHEERITELHRDLVKSTSIEIKKGIEEEMKKLTEAKREADKPTMRDIGATAGTFLFPGVGTGIGWLGGAIWDKFVS